jgi:hypothetical protein
MKIAKLNQQADGSFVWVTGKEALATVYPADGGWRAEWLYSLSEGWPAFLMVFRSAHDACLAIENRWPCTVTLHYVWVESAKGGYFLRISERVTVYVRKGANGWYAVQDNGKLLGKDGKVSWFATAMDACYAVQMEHAAPADADPFVSRADQLCWIKLRSTQRAA